MVLKVANIKHGDYTNQEGNLKDQTIEEKKGEITKCSYKIWMYLPSKCGNKMSREEIIFESKDDLLWITDQDLDSVCRKGIQVSMVSFYDEKKEIVRLFINFKESRQMRIIEKKMLSGYINYTVCYYLI